MLIFQNDIVIRGKKAEKYQELKYKYGFDLIDIYMMSGVIGYINHKKGIQEKDGNVTANIPRNVLTSRASKLDFLYQVITLNEEITVDSENAMKVAFENDSIEKPVKLQKKETFDEYALGGIDILYDMLSNTNYDNTIDNIKDILDTFINNSGVSEKTLDEIFEEEGF